MQQEQLEIPLPIEYRPESEWIEFPPDPGFYGCPKVSDWSDTTPLLNGDVILTNETNVTILFGYGLRRLSLHSDHGFTRRQIVNAIMLVLQAEHFEHIQNFLERVIVDQGLITFEAYPKMTDVELGNLRTTVCQGIERLRQQSADRSGYNLAAICFYVIAAFLQERGLIDQLKAAAKRVMLVPAEPHRRPEE